MLYCVVYPKNHRIFGSKPLSVICFYVYCSLFRQFEKVFAEAFKIVVFFGDWVYNQNMRPIIDTHTHTIASGHWTTDTVTDLARTAKQRELQILAVTDHSPSIPESAKESYFLGLKNFEKKRYGVRLLYGTEADVMDTNGELGLSDAALCQMDIVIASQHPVCFKPNTAEENTAALIAAIRTGKVDIVGHPDDEKYPLLLNDLVQICAEYGTAIEMNEASLTPGGYRGDARARDAKLLVLCKKAGVPVAMGSDSHGAAHVGVFTFAEKLIAETDFPLDLVVNYSAERFLSLLNIHRKFRGQKTWILSDLLECH